MLAARCEVGVAANRVRWQHRVRLGGARRTGHVIVVEAAPGDARAVTRARVSACAAVPRIRPEVRAVGSADRLEQTAVWIVVDDTRVIERRTDRGWRRGRGRCCAAEREQRYERTNERTKQHHSPRFVTGTAPLFS